MSILSCNEQTKSLELVLSFLHRETFGLAEGSFEEDVSTEFCVYVGDCFPKRALCCFCWGTGHPHRIG